MKYIISSAELFFFRSTFFVVLFNPHLKISGPFFVCLHLSGSVSETRSAAGTARGYAGAAESRVG